MQHLHTLVVTGILAEAVIIDGCFVDDCLFTFEEIAQQWQEQGYSIRDSYPVADGRYRRYVFAKN